MNLDLYKHIYLIGIGGIGMSALARYFNAKGKNVCGYDKVQSTLCKQLENEGIKIHYNDGVENIPQIIQSNFSLFFVCPFQIFLFLPEIVRAL